MTVRIVSGDMLKSDADIWVNPVNAVGVSGKGLAKVLRDRYPQMYAHYREECAFGKFRPGDVIAWRNPVYPVTLPLYIFSAATKHDWRHPSQLEWISLCCDNIIRTVDMLYPATAATKAPTIAVPALGCGEGGLSWDDVSKMIQFKFDRWDCDIELYRPYGNVYNVTKTSLRSTAKGKDMDTLIEITPREAAEINHALFYAEHLHHGTVGHNILMLLARLAVLQGFSIDESGKLVVPDNVVVVQQERGA